MGRGRLEIARVLLFGAALVVSRNPCPAQGLDRDGSIHLDVVVSDAAGRPVPGLQKQDFRILDEGNGRPIATFAAFDGVKTKPDPPAQMIIVIDSVNNGFVEMGYIRQGLEEFLRENGGQLGQPTRIARLVPSGIQTLSEPTVDGNALANIVGSLSATVKPRGLDALQVSLNGLVTIAKQEANEPGRKLLFWLGPGWPTPVPPQSALTDVDLRNQRTYYAVAIQIAKLLHDARMVLYGGYTAGDFYMRGFLKPLRNVSEVDPRILRLNVMAIKSGGKGELPETNRDSVVTDALKHVAAEANSFYELSFDPVKAQVADEFHQLRVAVNQPGLTARTITGYYGQPDQPRPVAQKEREVPTKQPVTDEPDVQHAVSVAQLTEVIQKAKGKRDGGVAEEIESLRLTDRLSSAKLAALNAELPGAKSRAALMSVGDASVFLEPPKEEIPDRPAPSAAEQREIASRAVRYLKDVIPKLPNFYAKRFTNSFEGVADTYALHPRGGDGVLRKTAEYRATVLYRNGKEETRAEGTAEKGLITYGTFGPILSTVIVDGAHSSTKWARWEQGPKGPMAVLRVRVPKEQSHYQVSFPAAVAGDGELSTLAPTAYHAEIGIDPGSGAILRLVLQADPELGSAMSRADIMVEYGSVSIGGKVYTCPVRGVSISEGESQRGVNDMGSAALPEKREVMRLDDVVFRDYHVFRSEMRIVPE